MKEHVYRKEVIQSLLLSLFYDVCNIFRKHQPANEGKRSRKEELFGLFMQTVLENYKQERSVAFYADKLCVTAKYLSLISKEVSGQPAGNWIDEYVILEAKTTALAKHYEKDFGAILLPTFQSSAPRYLIADDAAKQIFLTYLSE